MTAASLRAQPLSEKPLVTFGVVADAQYDRDTTVGVHGRRYHLAIERLSEAISVFNDRENIAFTVSLGDIIDRNHLCFPDLQPVLAKSKVKIHYVYGNHDYTHSYDPKGQKAFFKMVGQDDSYYSFVEGGVRFIVMNDNDPARKVPQSGRRQRHYMTKPSQIRPNMPKNITARFPGSS